MLYCPECLFAGYPEVISHVPVPLKVGFSNRNGLQSQSEAILTRLAAVKRIYVRADGWKKHATIYTYSLVRVGQHAAVLSALVIWFLLHDSVSHQAFSLYCCPITLVTCLLLLFPSSLQINKNKYRG